ncbi:MAG: HAD family hydrolase [Phycisphaerales bacterium]|nr:HAD family hydrolase [Phycisphaerae bacterium]NNF43664.1 HAD family hydrolase [Phycisphaerales bacterium]NNM24733.1 HAD family hydrolase [Phycisphaerales bacterium]
MTTRVAMWSGPRNISTALMRSWEARGDSAVCDEPLYACYLQTTGRDHPGAAEVIAHHETDWRLVTEALTRGVVPGAKPIFYQKHMAHHLLPAIERRWITSLVNCFLIRDPRAMLTSLVKVIPNPTVEETGLPQQVELFDAERDRTGRVPPVLDGRDVRTDPAGMLRSLCAAVGVAYTDRMLAWPPGPRPTDGIWARHWYDAVHRSTGFAPYALKPDAVPSHLAAVLAECQGLYDRLAEYRLRPCPAAEPSSPPNRAS